MISDAQAQALVPRKGWLSRWIQFSYRQTDAPLIYFLGSGLTVLSTAAPAAMFCYGPGGSKVKPGLFSLFEGRSVVERKSTVIRMAKRVIEASPLAARVGAFAETREALIEALQQRPIQLWVRDEFSTFLAQARGTSHVEPVKTALTNAYDGDTLDRRTFRAGELIANDYRLSIAAGISIGYLQRYLQPEDMTGGFLARWCVFFGARTRYIPWTRVVPNPTEEAALALHLALINELAPVGGVSLSPEALTLLENFGEAVNTAQLAAKESKQGALGRAELLAVKFAMLIGMDWYVEDRLAAGITKPPPMTEPLTITGEVMQAGINLAYAHVLSVDALVNKLRSNEFNRLKDIVLDVIKPGELCSIQRIISLCEIGSKKQHFEVLETLEAQGLIIRSNGAGGQHYWGRAPESEYAKGPTSLPPLLTMTPNLNADWFRAADDAQNRGAPVPVPVAFSGEKHSDVYGNAGNSEHVLQAPMAPMPLPVAVGVASGPAPLGPPAFISPEPDAAPIRRFFYTDEEDYSQD